MTPVHRHRDNAPATSSCLPEDSSESMAEERGGCLFLPLSQEVSGEKPRKLKIIMIREELVDLTGDPLTAAILGQMLYWCQEVEDFNLYIEEEKGNRSSSFQHGWFYKSKRELIDETMLRVTLATFRRYMNFLRCRGWIQTRRDPHNKLNSKVQYRVSLGKIHNDLQRKGHTLSSLEAHGIFPHSPRNICAEQKQKRANHAVESDTHSEERQS
ncbi:MAG: hypothetical protein K2P93_06915 [Alphaproteobacteria bacterium]|nr:hypothetical protein [Alphaproteobacteria bacterium]